MNKIGFIGAYDKTDFILYVAKALTLLNKKVIVIDSTILQKTRYIVPAINPTKSYITEFEKIDVAIGFNSFSEITQYLGYSENEELEYDIALIDVDNVEAFNSFRIQSCVKNYFVTSFDLYSLKRGLEIVNSITEPIRLTKILFSKDMLKEDDEYLTYLSLGTKVIWNDEFRIYLPLDNGDQSVIIENQRVSKTGIKKLSSQYKEALSYVVEDISTDASLQEIKKVFKLLEKEV